MRLQPLRKTWRAVLRSVCDSIARRLPLHTAAALVQQPSVRLPSVYEYWASSVQRHCRASPPDTSDIVVFTRSVWVLTLYSSEIYIRTSHFVQNLLQMQQSFITSRPNYIYPSGVANSRVSRRIFVRRQSAERNPACRNLFCAWQLQMCFRIMTDVMITSGILIIRLIKLCSADVVYTRHDLTVCFFKVNLLRLSCTSRKSATLYIISYCYVFFSCNLTAVVNIQP